MHKRFITQWRRDRAELDHYFDPPTPAEREEARRWHEWNNYLAMLWTPTGFHVEWDETTGTIKETR